MEQLPMLSQPVSVHLTGSWLESLLTILSDLVRVHPGRPAALPTATGWDEELRARTAGVRLQRPGHSESLFRTAIQMSFHAVSIGNGVTGGPESVRNG